MSECRLIWNSIILGNKLSFTDVSVHRTFSGSKKYRSSKIYTPWPTQLIHQYTDTFRCRYKMSYSVNLAQSLFPMSIFKCARYLHLLKPSSISKLVPCWKPISSRLATIFNSFIKRAQSFAWLSCIWRFSCRFAFHTLISQLLPKTTKEPIAVHLW